MIPLNLKRLPQLEIRLISKKKIPMYGENKMYNFPAKSRWVQGCREDQLKTPPVEEGD